MKMCLVGQNAGSSLERTVHRGAEKKYADFEPVKSKLAF
jgi:hypothetical protein